MGRQSQRVSVPGYLVGARWSAMNLSRFEHMRESKGTLAAGWAFNAHTVFDSHVPERFTRIRFSEQSVIPG